MTFAGTATNFLFINEGLQELHWFKQSYGSWFLGNYVCESIFLAPSLYFSFCVLNGEVVWPLGLFCGRLFTSINCV